MKLGKRILELRLKSKRTQQQVCELTGLAVSYLSRLENDRMSPSIRTLTKISEALHVPLTSFFDDKPILEANDRVPAWHTSPPAFPWHAIESATIFRPSWPQI